ncbi:hypothetical protein ACWD4L_40215 [Streptomyces sp. NPDC002596]
MSLLELIAAADERGLVASGIACLDRCLPQPAEGADPDPLCPLWAGCADGEAWPDRLAEARQALDGAKEAETQTQIRQLLAHAPADRVAPGLREWADVCSLLALEIHLGQDATPGAGVDLLRRCREGDPEGAGPLVAGEVRRQIRILEMLADSGTGAAGLRQVRDVSTEGQRVLRAATARRARGRGPGGE